MNLTHQPPAHWATRPGRHKVSGARFQVERIRMPHFGLGRGSVPRSSSAI